jgi:putative two-component system response regulator
VRVVIADDHEMVREGVKAALRFEDIEVIGEAKNGLDAVRLAIELKPDAMVLDNHMPGLSGIAVARHISRDLPNTAIVLLTMDEQVREVAMAAGVQVVISKDAPSGELARAVRQIAERWKRRSPGRRERDRLYGESVRALSAAIEVMELGPGVAPPRLAGIARQLALRLGRDEDEAERIELAMLLRDIGKTAIPDTILTKRAPLEPKEREQVRRHVTLGTQMLGAAPALRDLVPIVRHHHERYDGSGYPDGLRGDDIPLGSQIIGVLDAFNGIVSARPYKSPFPPEFALDQLLLGAGREFAARVVESFVEVYRRDRASVLG